MVSSSPLVWLVWDAASWAIVQQLIADGELPNLARMMQRGGGSPLQLDQLNCQTPAALATLFSGSSPAVHQVGGYYSPVAKAGGSAFGKASAFLEQDIPTSLFWEHAVKFGKSATLAHVPYTQRISRSPGMWSQYNFSVDGYSRKVARANVWRVSELVWQRPQESSLAEICHVRHRDENLTIYRDAKEGVMGYRMDRPLLAGQVTDPRIHSGAPSFGLDVLRGSCDDFLVLGEVSDLCSPSNSPLEGFSADSGHFIGEGIGRIYRSGLFGPSIADGGTGEAERLFLQHINLGVDYTERVIRHCLEKVPADVNIFYLPAIDEVSHEMFGYVDPGCPLSSERCAPRYRSLLAEVYRRCDQMLEALAGYDVVIASDHGMSGGGLEYYINEVFREEGWLKFDPCGRLVPEGTVIFFHPAENGAIFINSEEYEGGIVTASEKDKLRCAAIKLLAEQKDTATGGPIFAELTVPAAVDSRLAAIYGDLFSVPFPPYMLRAGSNFGTRVQPSGKTGYHHFKNTSPFMDAVLVSNRPELFVRGQAKNSDVFNMLCGILNIEDKLPGGN